MLISRMELADLSSPDALVEGILKQVPDMPIPVPIMDIARSVDITEIKSINAAGFEGGLITDRNKSTGVILVKRGSPRQRKRFTVGHELGHFLMPFHLPVEGTKFMCTIDDMRRSAFPGTMDQAMRMEVEANHFAASILIPATLFRRDIARSTVSDLDLLLSLADKYDTSKEATARRFCELNETPSAVVFSKDGLFTYSVRGQGFPFISLRRGETIPKESPTACYSGAQGEISSTVAVDGHLWVDAEPYCNHQLLEKTLPQIDGHRLTLLQIDEEKIEEAEEEEDLIESYTPRFRKR